MNHILLIFILLFIVYTIYDTSKYSPMNKFMTAQETNAFLAADKDGFVKSLNQINLFARRATSNEDYLKKISKSGRDFTEAQKNLINTLSKGSTYALVDKTYEDGYPHTREHVIFISDMPDLSTVVHEQMHIQQRSNPPDLEAMGYKLAGKRSDYPRARINPDVDDNIWISPITIKPMVAQFNSDRPLNLMDIDVPSQFEHPYEYLAYL